MKSLVTGYLETGVRFMVRAENFPFGQHPNRHKKPTQTTFLWVLETLCLWPDRLGYEAYLSHLYCLQLPTYFLFGNIRGDMRNINNFNTKSNGKKKLGDLNVDRNILSKWILKYMVYGYILDSTGLGLECVVFLCSSGVLLKDGNFSTS
jgi:hypothetical protein